MVRVAPIKLHLGSKVLWFDPADLDIHKGDGVIVSTKRGREYGKATSEILDVSDELVEALKSPLRPVERIATPEDEQRVADLESQSADALEVFKEFARETNEDMRPVMVEFLFDGDKAVFYFEAEERVDFRDLVRKLASHFHIRVDMRQIGVRDGARMVGGLGHCGQELCCCRMGGEFSPVSIRMAKEQNLSLNPQKISGACGRLMCCLRYEYEAYKDFNTRAPKYNAKVETPAGVCKVTEVNVPRETISLLTPEGKTVKVPLADFEPPEEGRRPHVVGEEAFERCASPDPFKGTDVSAAIEVASFVGGEKLADPAKRSRTASGEAPRSEKESRGRRRRHRGGSGKGAAKGASGSGQDHQKKSADAKGGTKGTRGGGSSRSQQKKAADQHEEGKKRTRRRRHRGGSGGNGGGNGQQPKQQGLQGFGNGKSKGGPRPGQNSSGVRNPASGSSPERKAAPTHNSHRTSRRRSHTAGKESSHEA